MINKNSINSASYSGHINVLDWFHNSCYEFKYNDFVINYFQENNLELVSKWFKENNYTFTINVNEDLSDY